MNVKVGLRAEAHASGPRPLRILHLEDDPNDRELVRHAVASEGLVCEFVYAQSRCEFENALSSRSFDLILSDFTLPAFDGVAALVSAREKRPTIPFVFVCWSLGEERAIDCLRSGASDYVLKRNLERLGPCVLRALRETEQRADREQLERDLVSERGLLRALLESLPELIYFKDLQLRFLTCNMAMARWLGAESFEQVIGKTDFDFHPRAEAESYLQDEQQVIQSGKPLLNRIEAQARGEGAWSWVSVTKVPVRDLAGKITGIVGISHDVTTLKCAEESLRQAEEKFRSIVENATEGIFQASPTGEYIMANPALARIYGFQTAEEFLQSARAASDFADPKREAERQRLLEKEGRVQGFESRVRHKDGHPIWISENTHAVRHAGGALRFYEGTIEDISARKEVEEALRESEERFREIAESIRDVFRLTSPSGKELLYVNPAYEAIWGRTLASLYSNPTSWLEAILDEDRGPLLEAMERLETGEEYKLKYRISRPDGTIRWIQDRGYPVRTHSKEIQRVVGLASDITERVQLEAQLLQSQKMEAIGQLAGCIAHDFNNLLTIINGHAAMALDGTQSDPETMESLKQIFCAGERASRLTRQLLVLSRKQTMHAQFLDMNDLVNEAAKMFRRLIGERVALELDLPAATGPFVRADPGMIEQILLNLIVNARDAMPKGGRVTVGVEAVTIAAPSTHPSNDARAGDFVCLSVRDDGCGIPPDVMPHIFEPFFTTKASGKGTGLGLATVFGLAKQHEGWVEVQSRPGEGAIFKVYLPAVAQDIALVEPASAQRRTFSGTETILVVEDEAAVRELAVVALEKHGYRVLQAASGEEALKVWARHGARIKLLLTDMVMPGDLTGWDLAEELRAANPELKVIYASGYSLDDEQMPAEKKLNVLHKPYHLRKLAEAVRQALDGTQPQE